MHSKEAARREAERQSKTETVADWCAIRPKGGMHPLPVQTGMLRSKTTPVIRIISLLWRKMGRARFYVLAAAGAVILLAASAWRGHSALSRPHFEGSWLVFTAMVGFQCALTLVAMMKRAELTL